MEQKETTRIFQPSPPEPPKIVAKQIRSSRGYLCPSLTEFSWDRLLLELAARCAIVFQHEPEIYRLHKLCCWYLPDFAILLRAHALFLEIKGLPDELGMRKCAELAAEQNCVVAMGINHIHQDAEVRIWNPGDSALHFASLPLWFFLVEYLDVPPSEVRPAINAALAALRWKNPAANDNSAQLDLLPANSNDKAKKENVA